MIISDKYKIIFIHIPKNAGTYITQILYTLDNNIKRYTLNSSGHIKAKDCIDLIGLEKFNEYTKFCVIRNTFDKTYSYYNYVKTEKNHNDHELFLNKSFEQFVDELCFIDQEFIDFVLLNSPYILNNDGKLLIDNLLRFDNLHEDLISFFEKYNIPLILPKEKINESIHYIEERIEKLDIKLNEILKKDINYFNMI